ncbi:MAG: tRNA 2-thiouridine(34) synthase MnmA, partial [Dehalococcoidia bacterium]|nr:tRNA 2-thiouridine(34) synthase MnmA [Dehalococcoidia bacterium]
EDIEDARDVARILGIDFHVFDLKQEYKDKVLDYFCGEYLSGRTPNPCVRCNRQIKFDILARKARQAGIEFDYFATGHYARVEYDELKQRYLLKKARDRDKDQSYFISSLSQEQLSRALFPVGDYTKGEVRKMADKFGLAVGAKAESQDFIAGDYSALMGAMLPGPIMDDRGNILGEHRGIPFYTIGQRKKLGISAGEPLYVTGIDQGENAVIVGSREGLYQDELVASEVNWIAVEKLEQPVEVKARIRYRHMGATALVQTMAAGRIHLKFEAPQRAITPGQTVVLYQGDMVLCSGRIEKAGR